MKNLLRAGVGSVRAPLTENPGVVPNTQAAPEDPTPSSGSYGHCTHVVQAVHIHMKTNVSFKNLARRCSSHFRGRLKQRGIHYSACQGQSKQEGLGMPLSWVASAYLARMCPEWELRHHLEGRKEVFYPVPFRIPTLVTHKMSPMYSSSFFSRASLLLTGCRRFVLDNLPFNPELL